MFKNKFKLILYTIILSIILNAISIVIQRKLVNANPKIMIYKTNKTMEVGEEIKESDLIEGRIEAISNTDFYIKDKNELVGKVVKEKIYSGELFNKNRLIDKNDSSIFISNNNSRRFGIPVQFIDDQYSLTFRKGDIVDIVVTEIADNSSNKNIKSRVALKNAKVIGAIDSDGRMLNQEDKNKLAQSIIFESSTMEALDITENQYKGKIKLVKVPVNK